MLIAPQRYTLLLVAFVGDGLSGLMFVLRGTAERNERGEGPPVQVLYAPETVRAARKRLALIWLLALSWLPALLVPWLLILVVLTAVGVVVAVATLIEPAWLGSPIRPLVALSIPVAVVGLILVAVL